MISSVNLNIDFTKDYLAITSEDINIDKIDNGVKVYIPLLMCEIDEGEPKYKQLQTAPLNIFKNASTCKFNYKSTIREQNFLIAKKENNNSLSIIKNNNDIIPKNTKLQVDFIHGRINSLVFNTDIKL